MNSEAHIMSKDKFPSIFLCQNEGYSVCYPSYIFYNTRIFHSFIWCIFSHVMYLNQLKENIRWILNVDNMNCLDKYINK